MLSARMHPRQLQQPLLRPKPTYIHTYIGVPSHTPRRDRRDDQHCLARMRENSRTLSRRVYDGEPRAMLAASRSP